MNTPITVTHESLTQAFEAWENGYRTKPTAFRTEEECAAMGVQQLSVERADYFLTLLHELQAKANSIHD